jgi:hypothetical protein
VRPVPIGEEEEDGRGTADRGQMAVQERLEVAVRGRHPRALLDLQDELTTGRPIRARGDDDDARRLGQARGDALGTGGVSWDRTPIALATESPSSERPDRCAPTLPSRRSG